MAGILQRFDRAGGLGDDAGAALLLGRAAFFFLLLMAAAAPHSIAATQTAWLLGLTAWAVRSVITGSWRDFRPTALDAVLLAFVGWSVLSAVFSYEPLVSLDKLRNVGLFLILYFTYSNLRTVAGVKLLMLVLVCSAMVNVVWQPVERIIGRGVEIRALAADSPLAKAGLIAGDTVLRVNGSRVSTPDEIAAAFGGDSSVKITFHRPDLVKTVEATGSLATGGSAAERLGIGDWGASYRWRASGFYGHFTTYSEMLQLVGSVVLGVLLWLAFGPRGERPRTFGAPVFIALVAALGLIGLALLLSGTRGSQLGLMASAFAMVAALGNKRVVVGLLLLAVPLGAAGYVVLMQTRQQTETNEYRKMMWRDGARLAVESPRHLMVGVGMDSLKTHWREFRLFDGGMQPMGHFHSTPIQLAAERGLPALLLWLAFVGLLIVRLWRAIKARELIGDRVRGGITLGILGAVVGFFVGGIVHYNLGDGEVAMIFYMLAGAGLRSVDQRATL